jgi:KDO2-lipid IV(A) lauroyltransferase
MPTQRRPRAAETLAYGPQMLGLGILRTLPHGARLRLGAALMRSALLVVPDLRARIDGNLALVFPEMPAPERLALRRAAVGNIGRTLIETMDSNAFQRRAPWSEPRGPGWPALQEAIAAGKGAILVSGHFGQWEAVRGALKARGIVCGALYRPLKNPLLEPYYLANLRAPGEPIISRDNRGLRELVRHVRGGGLVAVLLDQYVQRGATIDFLGHPAPTGTFIAEVALKYGVPMMPAYGTRRPDGVHIDIDFEAPIPPTDPQRMTQATADSLAARIRAHPAQYYWLHRRWVKRF